MPHRQIGGRRSRLDATEALFNRCAPERASELLPDHRYVLVQVVVHVELAARTVRIQHAYLDHMAPCFEPSVARTAGGLSRTARPWLMRRSPFVRPTRRISCGRRCANAHAASASILARAAPRGARQLHPLVGRLTQ